MTTLAEAIEFGQGIERPFRCEQHDDQSASASVNVVKGVWICYACNARGAIDNKKAPSMDALAAMLEPEKTPRIYPETYLELFAGPGYWHTRFPDWLVWAAGLGEDPVTGHGTIPVRTPSGHLAGISRRLTDEQVATAKEAGENPSRYKYPYKWSASRTLHDRGAPRGPVLVLVEGAADQVAMLEVGIPTGAVYGSGLHAPQVELIKRKKPELVVLGFDDDEAGRRATRQTLTALSGCAFDIATVTWPKKDPAECSPTQRLSTVCSVVGEGYLEHWSNAVAHMQAAFHDEQDQR